MHAAKASLRFAHFELRPHERRLLVGGEPSPLGARAFDVLVALAERAGQLVSKHELMDLVWPGVVVEENNLQVHVSALRKVLGGDIIATIPGRGYRFTAHIEAPAGTATLPLAPASSAAGALKSNLSATTAPLIGRDEDLASLGALVQHHGLVTILGAGGIGKSALARTLLRERCDRYAHGVCWVELAALPATGALPDALPGAVAAALGIRLGGGDALAALASAVAPLDMMIALDNAEHLYADLARVAEALRQAAPQVRLLVTSQTPLKASGERLYRLDSLACPGGPVAADAALGYAAVALFVERAQALDRRFALTDANVGHVVALCRALDGLPLAIELAAARYPLLGLPALAAGLDQRLRLLTSATHDAPARQQTLRAALEWSHGLLGPNEQAVLRRLAVFVGSASLQMAQQVACDASLDAWAVLDALGALVDRSLVAVTNDGEVPRYRLLDTPHAFALEQLAASGEMEAVRERHAAVLREHFDRTADERWSGRIGLEAWLESAQPDLDNARAAFAWARANDPACAVAVCAGVIGALPASLHGQRYAMWEATEPLLGDGLAPALRARAMMEAADICGAMLAKRARGYAEQASHLLRELDDRFGLYRALARLARLAAPYDAPAAHVALAEMRALEIDTWPACRRLCGAAAEQACASWFHDPQQALSYAYRLMALEREAGSGVLHGLVCVVDVELELGHAAEALRHGLDLVARLQGSRYRAQLALAQVNLVEAWLANDHAAQARDVAVAGWPEALRYGQQPSWADSLALLAALERRPRTSALLRGYADAMYAAQQATRQVAEGITAQRAEQLARAALGASEFERLKADGAALRDQDIVDVAFAQEDAAPGRTHWH